MPQNQDVSVPIARNDEDTLKERMSSNAYDMILPGRYLNKDQNGDVVETPEELFERVAKNIAVADSVHYDNVTIGHQHIKPNHPRRDELTQEVFGSESDMVTHDSVGLTEENAKYVDYDELLKSLDESDAEALAATKDEFHDMMEHLKWMPNSPTLMNAGDELQQLSACFVDTPEDDINEIYDTLREAANVMQSGGGMGYSFSDLRPYGDIVGSSGGIASGPLTFMHSYDTMCGTIAQGGTRRGAQMANMHVWHPDIPFFIHAKNKDVSLMHSLLLNDPDDMTNANMREALEEARELIDDEGRVPEHLRNAAEGHLSNFNISVFVTDEFMEALENGEKFTFKNPRTGDAHVSTRYTKELWGWFGLGEYVEVDEPLEVPAEVLWDRIIDGAYENGEPGVIFDDRVNEEHSFDVEEHPERRIKATNPCLPGHAQVAVADGRGTVSMEALAEKGENVDVYAYDDEEDQVCVRKGMSPRKTGIDEQLYEVKTTSGRRLECTGDHEINTVNRGVVEAENLRTDDWVRVLEDEYSGTDAINPSSPPVKCEVCGDEYYRLTDSHFDHHRMSMEAYEQNYGVLEANEYWRTDRERITGVEKAGTADVYNLTVDEYHNYYASVNGGAINVENCGEQPLMNYEACNLGHVNLSTVVEEDRELWKDYEMDASNPSLDTVVNQFLDDAIDWDEMQVRVRSLTRFLDNVVTMSNFPVQEIDRSVRNNRKIGLGIMGMAQMFVQLGIPYGSEESEIAARRVMQEINWISKDYSHELAIERENFQSWYDSKYNQPTHYREWFEKQTGKSADKFSGGYGMRNHNTTTIAPTGTTSMIANTTGGCEPMFNVAYYKNVSDDVQGDEMLVEMDSYFERTLEANDIDVDEVKAHVLDLMENNEYDNPSDLEMVPDEITDLFVTTGQLSGIEHASIQCACQDGVDSAISKTCNFPNEATREDMDEVYRYIYQNDGKGVTVYRDGTRSKQVLTTRKDNQDLGEDEEMPEDLTQEEYFEWVEDHWGQEIADGVRKAVEVRDEKAKEEGPSGGVEPRNRPKKLTGSTEKISTGYGTLYATTNVDDNGQPFEQFSTIGKSGGYTESWGEAVSRMISLALRSGVEPQKIIDQLSGIRAPDIGFDNGEQVLSVPDGMAKALERTLEQQKTVEIEAVDDGQSSAHATGESESDVKEIVSSGESPECPKCSSMLIYSEGCKKCEHCGWSEC